LNEKGDPKAACHHLIAVALGLNRRLSSEAFKLGPAALFPEAFAYSGRDLVSAIGGCA